MGKPIVHIIGCGGTIAGRAASDQELIGYKAGEIGVDELITAMPELTEIAHIQGEQLCNIDSTNMSEAIWLSLAARVQELVNQDGVDGVVITHGTDTMEETAYFLNLTVHTSKPVVFVGAMRPATALSADGPLNLLNAVHLAACPEAGQYGVLVAMNDQISSARNVTKTNTTHVDSFKSWELGYVGYFQNGRPCFYNMPARLHTNRSDLTCAGVSALPPVWVLYCHVGISPIMVQAAVQAGARGLVVAGLGHGNIPDDVLAAIEAAQQEQSLIVVRASRAGNGIISPVAEDKGKSIVAGDNLSCQKAKLLLQLALLKTEDPAEIQRIFDTY